MADGIEYGCFQLKETGKPVDVIYPVEGSPLIIGPNGILKSAPNPNAARLLQSFMLSAECQQFNVDSAACARPTRWSRTRRAASR
jgi:iron(III) transport system substrate-binding protein